MATVRAFSAPFLINLALLFLSVFLLILSWDYPPMARNFPHLVLWMIMVVTVLEEQQGTRTGRGPTAPGSGADGNGCNRRKDQGKRVGPIHNNVGSVYMMFRLYKAGRS